MSCRLLFVGGGHAHCLALRSLVLDHALTGVNVTMISDSTHAVYSGMLPGAVAGLHDEDEIRIDLNRLTSMAGVTFVEGRVEEVNATEKWVSVYGREEKVHFDVLSINVGSITRVGDTRGVEEFCIRTRPIASLIPRLLAFEADLAPKTVPRMVVVGGGAAGCELAMAVHARHVSLLGSAHVSLVAGARGFLGNAGERLDRALREALSARKIRVVVARAVAVDADKVVVDADQEPVPADCVLWAAGAAPSALLSHVDLDLAEDGFIAVKKTLQALRFPYVFASGDCASVADSPQIERAGVFAVREAPTLAYNIKAACDACMAGTPATFQEYEAQSSFLRLVMTGDGSAVAYKWGYALTSWINWKLKKKLDLDFVNLFV